MNDEWEKYGDKVIRAVSFLNLQSWRADFMICEMDRKRNLRQILVVVAHSGIFTNFVDKVAEELSIAVQLFFATYTFVLWSSVKDVSSAGIFLHPSLGLCLILFTQHACLDLCWLLQVGSESFSHWNASWAHNSFE